MDKQILEILFMIFIPFLFVVFLMPFIKKLAFQINAVDEPRERHIHSKVVPKLGGLGIFAGFLLGYMIFGQTSAQMNSILIGSFIIILLGVIDDICELSALPQLLGQIAAASIIVFYGKIVMADISAFGFYLDFGIFSQVLTIFFIVGCINCINLIDGLDGLSGGISSIYFLTIGIICCLKGFIGLQYVLTFVMLGSTLGFLVYNFNPASIFAGDCGSNFMGFIIAIIALLGFKSVTLSSLIIPLLIIAIPILDTLFAILRRLLKGQSLAKGDRFHIHHQLLNRNFSQAQAVLIIYAIDILFAFASIVYVLKDRILGYIIYGALLIIVLTFVLKTNVVFEPEEVKKKLFSKKKNK